MCLLKYLGQLKDFPHFLHTWGLSVVCIVICPTRDEEYWRACSQSSHSQCFSPVWVLMCRARYEWQVKDFLQTLHMWVFCPCWPLSCPLKDKGKVRAFPDFLQSEDRLSPWLFTHLLHVLPASWHLWGSSTMSVPLEGLRHETQLQASPHSSHG